MAFSCNFIELSIAVRARNKSVNSRHSSSNHFFHRIHTFLLNNYWWSLSWLQKVDLSNGIVGFNPVLFNFVHSMPPLFRLRSILLNTHSFWKRFTSFAASQMYLQPSLQKCSKTIWAPFKILVLVVLVHFCCILIWWLFNRNWLRHHLPTFQHHSNFSSKPFWLFWADLAVFKRQKVVFGVPVLFTVKSVRLDLV